MSQLLLSCQIFVELETEFVSGVIDFEVGFASDQFFHKFFVLSKRALFCKLFFRPNGLSNNSKATNGVAEEVIQSLFLGIIVLIFSFFIRVLSLD